MYVNLLKKKINYIDWYWNNHIFFFFQHFCRDLPNGLRNILCVNSLALLPLTSQEIIKTRVFKGGDAAHWVYNSKRAGGNVRGYLHSGRRYGVFSVAKSGTGRCRWRVDNIINTRALPLPCPTLLAMPIAPIDHYANERRKNKMLQSDSCGR